MKVWRAHRSSSALLILASKSFPFLAHIEVYNVHFSIVRLIYSTKRTQKYRGFYVRVNDCLTIKYFAFIDSHNSENWFQI